MKWHIQESGFRFSMDTRYGAFLCDVMLSSNMAASIATVGNQYSFMQASFYIIVRNGFSMNLSIRGSSAWWSRARGCPGYLGQSAQSDGHVGGQHDVGENALYGEW